VKPKIQWIDWLGCDEAILTVTDGQFVCKVFAHPFAGRVEDPVDGAIVCFDTVHIQRSEGAEPSVQVREGFVHEIVGRVVDPSCPLVRVGAFAFAPDMPLPGDICAGQLVTIRTQRLDYPWEGWS
jgi:hypothetical protein